ncbi:hypothetical protein P6U16_08505 [Rhizobium sp. 32-5/1]|uniref:phage regulatory CII family protein n=1 Tax=Rhizobium sp. 32-5/1 TaxID=3019602 RepID=UPI00240E1F26|nr:phage regulatory CII family protein [Rhizobium sp. 32-5/1]WEZ84599.1 hypothetical protein P6U16_08505 [Rhizobium sp. 32-5/1]
MRTISDKQGKMLKGAMLRGLTMAGGGAVVQHSTRINEKTLSKQASGSDDHEKTFTAIDVAVEIDMLAGTPVITAMMAEMLGYQLVPVETGSHVADALAARDAIQLMSEAMDAVKVINAAVSDNHLDAAERRDVMRELEELLKLARHLQQRVSA